MQLFKNNIINSEINIKLPWVEKYRPQSSEDIILDSFIKEKITSILLNKSIPNMIITGEPSTGKTSTILYLAKTIYNDNYDDNVLELNASDDRGLSIINNTIYPFCKKKILNKKHKLVILDEADSITSKAQNLLSNIITDFINNTRFVFICNDCTQIIESIQSKCMIIKYPKINYDDLFNKIKYICNIENINYDDASIHTLLFVSDNDIRKAINNLECIYYSYNKLDEESIYKLIDKPKPYYIIQILENCYKNDYTRCIKIIKELSSKGYTPNDILSIFMKFLFEYKNDIEYNNIILNDEIKLAIYDIISTSYIIINDGVDTLLQLCGCISKIFIYLQTNK